MAILIKPSTATKSLLVKATAPASLHTPAFDLASGCVLYLRGLPGKGLKAWDSSGQGNHGTIVAATWERLPSGLWVMKLDGTDDYIDIPDVFNSLAVGTLLAWIKLDELEIYHDLFCCSTLTDNNDYLQFYPQSDNKLHFNVANGTANVLFVKTNATLSAGVWYRVGVTVSASGNLLYINGAQQAVTYTAGNAATQAFFNTVTGATKETYLHRFPYDNVYYARFKGSATGYEILNVALSAAQMEQDYEQQAWAFS